MPRATLRDHWRVYQSIAFEHLAPKTRAEYRSAMRRAFRALPARPARADVAHWLADLSRELSPAYTNFCLRVLRSVVRTATVLTADAELAAAVLSVRPLREPPLSRRCPPDDFRARALGAAKNPAERAWLRLAGEAGLRRGELMGLRPDAIDWRAGVVHVTRQRSRELRKNRRPHAVVVDRELLRDLAWTIANREQVKPRTGRFRGRSDGFLFPWALRFLEGFLERVRGHFGAERDQYLPKGLGWHAWRHAGATELARRGASILEIQQWLGDADPKMACRYVADVRGATCSKLLTLSASTCEQAKSIKLTTGPVLAGPVVASTVFAAGTRMPQDQRRGTQQGVLDAKYPSGPRRH